MLFCRNPLIDRLPFNLCFTVVLENKKNMPRFATTHDPDRSTNNLAAIAAVLFIVALSLIVVRKLQVRCMLEACLMSQSPGCEVKLDRLRVSNLLTRVVGQ